MDFYAYLHAAGDTAVLLRVEIRVEIRPFTPRRILRTHYCVPVAVRNVVDQPNLGDSRPLECEQLVAHIIRLGSSPFCFSLLFGDLRFFFGRSFAKGASSTLILIQQVCS